MIFFHFDFIYSFHFLAAEDLLPQQPKSPESFMSISENKNNAVKIVDSINCTDIVQIMSLKKHNRIIFAMININSNIQY